MIYRGAAAFLGGFTLLNIAGDLFVRGFDANGWWIDVRPIPPAIGACFLALVGAALLCLAARRSLSSRFRSVCIASLLVAGVFAVANILTFYGLVLRGRIHSGFPVPVSLFVLVTLGWVAWRAFQGSATQIWKHTAFGLLGSAIVFPLVQVIGFGSTDYRRPADVIVVFGARAYADGRPSQALSDRVRTACELYRKGYARTLIFSGGPGDGAISEPQAMRRQAISLGVPDEAIHLDERGLSTVATDHNTVPFLRDRNLRRVLAVSHGYHLPRLKIAFRRAGYDVYTVPAKETRRLRAEPLRVMREVPALW